MNDGSTRQFIRVGEMCEKHTSLLVRGAGYKPTDTWRALVIAANAALFQAVTADEFLMKRINNELSKIDGLGCLACRKPDCFGEIVEAGKSKDLKNIKALGDSWVEGK